MSERDGAKKSKRGKKGKKKKEDRRDARASSKKKKIGFRKKDRESLRSFLTGLIASHEVDLLMVDAKVTRNTLEYFTFDDLIACGLSKPSALALLKEVSKESDGDKNRSSHVKRRQIREERPECASFTSSLEDMHESSSYLTAEAMTLKVLEIAQFALLLRSEVGSLPVVSQLSSLESLLEYEHVLLELAMGLRDVPKDSVNDGDNLDALHVALLDAVDNVNDAIQLLQGYLSADLKIPTLTPDVPITRAQNSENCAWVKHRHLRFKPKKTASSRQRRRAKSGEMEREPSGALELHNFTSKEIAAMYERRTRVLGEGTFGTAVETVHSGRKVALKIMKERVDPEELLAEIRALQAAGGHPHVIEYIGCSDDVYDAIPGMECDFAIVTELLGLPHEPLGLPPGAKTIADVKQLLDSDILLSPYDRIKIALDAAKGLQWLHTGFKPGIVHRDIAPKNIFVTWTPQEGYVGKLGDLGLARKISRGGVNIEDPDRFSRPQGTPLTMAPEVMKYHAHNAAADVFSFGLTLWQLWTRLPLETKELVKTLKKIDSSDIFGAYVHAITELGLRPEIPPGTPRKLTRVIRKCWATQPSERLPMKLVVQYLEELLVEFAIPEDPDGQAFWNSNFHSAEAVSWEAFSRRFFPLMGVDTDRGEARHVPLVYITTTTSAPNSDRPINGSNLPSHHSEETVVLKKESSCKGKAFLRRTSTDDARLSPRDHKPTTVFKDTKGETSSKHLTATVRLSTNQKSVIAVRTLCAVERGESSYMVTARSFGDMLAWFGPLGSSVSSQFLPNVCRLLSERWFHLHPRDMALRHEPKGTFFVRKSSSRGAFVVAISSGGGEPPIFIRVVPVPGNPGTYTIQNSISFDSIHAVVEFLKTTGPTLPVPIILTKPLSGGGVFSPHTT